MKFTELVQVARSIFRQLCQLFIFFKSKYTGAGQIQRSPTPTVLPTNLLKPQHSQVTPIKQSTTLGEFEAIEEVNAYLPTDNKQPSEHSACEPNIVTSQELTRSVKVAMQESIIYSEAVEIPIQQKALSNETWLDINGEKVALSVVLESLLFVADAPVIPSQLAKLLNVTEAVIAQSLETLAQFYEDAGRGMRLQAYNGKFQLVSHPNVAALVEDFLNLEATTKLSGPALETLAVIAYRQPLTRMQIEAVRGVDSSGILRSLLQRGLIEEVGRLEVAGRPFLYGVTTLFMQHFGLTRLDELPALETSEADTLWAATKLAEITALPDDELKSTVSQVGEKSAEL